MSLQSDLAAVEAKISHYNDILRKLYDYQGKLNTEDGNLNNEYDPPESYDLTGGSDWNGAKEQVAEEMRTQINSSFSSYDGEVGQLKQDIVNAIANIQSMIAAAESEAGRIREAIAEEERRAREEAERRAREEGDNDE